MRTVFCQGLLEFEGTVCHYGNKQLPYQKSQFKIPLFLSYQVYGSFSLHKYLLLLESWLLTSMSNYVYTDCIMQPSICSSFFFFGVKKLNMIKLLTMYKI